MNLKISQFPIINKGRKAFEYVKDVYKKRIQSEADSFFNRKPVTTIVQDILYVDRISI